MLEDILVFVIVWTVIWGTMVYIFKQNDAKRNEKSESGRDTGSKSEADSK